jgi:hypothetical protein
MATVLAFLHSKAVTPANVLNPADDLRRKGEGAVALETMGLDVVLSRGIMSSLMQSKQNEFRVQRVGHVLFLSSVKTFGVNHGDLGYQFEKTCAPPPLPASQLTST